MGNRLAAAALVVLFALWPAVPALGDTPTVQVSGDQFERQIALVGPLEGQNPFGGTTRFWRIRSWVDKKTHAVSHQLYVDITYIGDWRNYEIASDDTASDLKVTAISQKVISCSPCILEEVVGIDMDEAALRGRQTDGYAIKLKARSGDDLILQVDAAQISLQEAAVDKYVKDPGAAALAVPLGQSPQDEAFGVTNFGEPWGMSVRRDEKLLGVTDLHEYLAASIKRDSIAQKAGLRWADTIYEFDAHRFGSLQELLELIRAVPPGKAVDFKIIRINKLMTLHAQF